MSGLFRRLSSRRSAGPEGNEPHLAAEPGATDAPAPTAAEPGGHESLLTDPAATHEPEAAYVPPAGEEPTRIIPEPALAPEPETGHVPTAGPEPTRIAPEPAAAPEPEYVAPRTPLVAPPVYPGPHPYGTQVPGAPEPVPVADLPAGLDPDELGAVPPTSARRGKLRRRAAFLRAARELLLRDLGGFVYELHRTAHDVEHEAHRRLRETKLARLTRVDAELHDLEMLLDDVRRQVLVREPGVGGECPQCGELFGSAAHFCSQCGLPLTESARRELARAQAPPEPAPDPVLHHTPAPVVEQPTEELSPLDPDHPSSDTEFQWPRRDEQAPSWTSEPSGLARTPEAEPATAVLGEPGGDEATSGPETRDGAAPPAADEAAREAVTTGSSGDAERGAVVNGQAASGADPDEAVSGAPTSSPEASREVAGDAGADGGVDATGEADSPGDGERAATGAIDAPPEPEPDDAPPNGSIFSPVERRP